LTFQTILEPEDMLNKAFADLEREMPFYLGEENIVSEHAEPQ
jgi:hypothetical protein